MTGDPQPVETLSFEDALAELEEIVSRLEGGQGSLNDAIEAYERGSILKRHCQAKLEEARLRVERIRVPENDADDLGLER
ncbi:MAG: exodeoxyribonuclease VII small subunit [Alphaproteobacteria bacterium]|nr:exodeoxyribonuclease VII small subunit [Alphaproteobacteria bacterium]